MIDLHQLPTLEDRLSYLYPEHGWGVWAAKYDVTKAGGGFAKGGYISPRVFAAMNAQWSTKVGEDLNPQVKAAAESRK